LTKSRVKTAQEKGEKGGLQERRREEEGRKIGYRISTKKEGPL
jgi:hypothetical protein